MIMKFIIDLMILGRKTNGTLSKDEKGVYKMLDTLKQFHDLKIYINWML